MKQFLEKISNHSNEDNIMINIESNDSKTISDSESSSDSEKSEKNEEKERYNKLYSNLIEHFNKNKFRSVYSELEKNKEEYFKWNLKHDLIFSHLQIRCAFQIVDKKFIDYGKVKVIKGIAHWLDYIEDLINKFIPLINMLPKKDQPDQYELLTLYYLSNLYNNALYNIHNKLYFEAIGHLLNCHKIIQNLSKDITYPDILHMSEKIYLTLTIILMSDKNYYSAINFLQVILSICFKELDLMIYNIKNTLTKRYRLSVITSVDVFFNMATCFYLLGVCFEKLHDLDKAVDTYKQAYWIAKNFLFMEYPKIENFLFLIHHRICSHFKIFNIVSQIDLDKIVLDEDTAKNKKKSTIFLDDNKSRLEKFYKIEKIVEKIKPMSVDDDEADLFDEVGKKPKSKNVLKLIGNIKLYNYLSSNDFKPTLTNEIKNLRLHDIDKDTKRKIQKKIFYIKQEKRLQLHKQKELEEKIKAEKKNELKKNVSRNFNSLRESYKTSLSKNNNNTINNTKININNKKNNNNNFSELNMNLNSSTNKHPLSPSFRNSYKQINTSTNINPKPKKNFLNTTSSGFYTTTSPNLTVSSLSKPLKISYDKYVFNKNYRKKINFIENQMSKEYNFQKDLLHLKRFEIMNLDIEPFEEQKIKNDVMLFYTNRLNDQIKIFKEKNKSIKAFEKEQKIQMYYNKLIYYFRDRVCKSLNYKDKEKYMALMKKCDKNKDFFFELKDKKNKQQQQPQSEEPNEISEEELKKLNESRNKDFINKLEYDIENIDKRENLLYKIYRKKDDKKKNF
jgi:hypothetical protein